MGEAGVGRKMVEGLHFIKEPVMGRIITRVGVTNLIDPSWAIELDALVDTAAAGLVLPGTWRERLGVLPLQRTVEAETADQGTIEAQVCGPVRIQVQGFPPWRVRPPSWQCSR
jgi:hypothetical protein